MNTNAHALSARLADLLRAEQGAMADFLLALADFDQRRLWVDLGYKSLFAYLHRELGLSRSAAHYRKTVVELIQRFPQVEAAFRSGKLCLLWNDRSTTRNVRSFRPDQATLEAANSTVDHPAIRGSGPGPPHNRDPSGAASHLRRGSGAHSRRKTESRTLLYASASNAACSSRNSIPPYAAAQLAPLRATSFPIAHTNPRSSRATAMTATFRCFPLKTSLPYRP